MPEEHESAAAAWLSSPDTIREVSIIQQRFSQSHRGNGDYGISQFEATLLALGIEVLAALDLYGWGEGDDDPDDDDPPWRPRAA